MVFNTMKNIHTLPFPELISEMVNYSHEKSLELKVLRVHSKCLVRKHYALADKIKTKYKRYFLQSDFEMAFRIFEYE